MNRNIILKARTIGVRFISRAIEDFPVKLAYVSYDQETPKEVPNILRRVIFSLKTDQYLERSPKLREMAIFFL